MSWSIQASPTFNSCHSCSDRKHWTHGDNVAPCFTLVISFLSKMYHRHQDIKAECYSHYLSTNINYKFQRHALAERWNSVCVPSSSTFSFLSLPSFLYWLAIHRIIARLTYPLRIEFHAFSLVLLSHMSLCTQEVAYNHIPMLHEKVPTGSLKIQERNMKRIRRNCVWF